MSYIRRKLMDGEELVHRTRLHWGMFLPPLLFALVAVPFLYYEVWIGAGIVLGVAAVWALILAVRYFSTEFAVTNRRVVRKRGVLRHSSLELHLSKVEGAQVEQGLGGRIFRYGSMVVTGTGGLQHSFDRISDPIGFRAAIQRELSDRPGPMGEGE